MPDHYTRQDKHRTSSIKWTLVELMLEKGWFDLKALAKEQGWEYSTTASKFRELADKHHFHLGYATERRSIGQGRHEYRLSVRQPAQMPLFEAVA